ncbi:MAG: hypothetical protein CVT69_00130 [Actinobacteria bacterium HGW-Actinobacteria-9]|jgi:hypothetical protein|nr:MAG: hypothetical protein CVT69_00130 [Actinobacteria bacterium HGW-Actinobacteria-9]
MKTTVKTATATLTSKVVVGTLLIAILAAAAPTITNAMATDSALPFTTSLTTAPAPVKFVIAANDTTALSTSTAKALASVAVVKPAADTTPVTTATKTVKTAVKNQPVSTDAVRARTILAGLIAKYPILQGTTVTMGDARGYQAIALYKSGQIIISPTHTASLERILNHEIWHIIDWRDNGVIDWGENVPPK